MGAETVIAKINEKASAEAESIIASAKEKAEQTASAIVDEANAKAAELIEAANAKAELTVKRAEQQARLEKRIAALNYQHELIDSVRDDAKRVMLAFPDKMLEDLYGKLVKENAVTGNVAVRVSSSDRAKYSDGSLLKKWSDAVTEATGVATVMTLSNDDAPIDGGIILCGEIFDIDLSFDALLDTVFAENEKSIADRLFKA